MLLGRSSVRETSASVSGGLIVAHFVLIVEKWDWDGRGRWVTRLPFRQGRG